MLVTVVELRALITEAFDNDLLSAIKANDTLTVDNKQYLVVKAYGKPKFITRHAMAFGMDDDDVEIWSDEEYQKTQFKKYHADPSKFVIVRPAWPLPGDPLVRWSSKTMKRTSQMIGREFGSFRYEERCVRVNKNVMSSFGGLPVRKKDLIDLRVVAFVDGDDDMFDEWLAQEAVKTHMDQSTYVNVNDVKYTGGLALEPMADLGDFKKPDIIAYVVSLNGPLTRKQILKQVATIQGLPYIPTSNTSYFRDLQAIGLQRAQSEGRKQAYTTTPDGDRMAKRVIDAIGEQPAIDVREDL